MGRNYDIINFISKYLYFTKTRVAGFADIIKTATMFKVKKFKKKIEIMYKMQSMSVFLYITKVADFR